MTVDSDARQARVPGSTAATAPAARPPKFRGLMRWLKILTVALVALLVAFLIGVVAHAPVCLPFDWVWNLGAPLEAAELRSPADGKTRVVFLQHGLWRTPMSLDRLERTLRHQGYEVVNCGYPSMDDYLEGHAKRLRDAVEARFAVGGVHEVSFVGHSMGGLVIQEYLRREDAREPAACVYLATPHRGATLADKRRHWWLFGLAMGSKAAQQLATSDPFHQKAIPFAPRSGTIVGDIGPGNGAIPGDDDGTVGCAEATFAGAKASVHVPVGHTRIVIYDEVLRQVLHFLRKGDFAAPSKTG